MYPVMSKTEIFYIDLIVVLVELPGGDNLRCAGNAALKDHFHIAIRIVSKGLSTIGYEAGGIAFMFPLYFFDEITIIGKDGMTVNHICFVYEVDHGQFTCLVID